MRREAATEATKLHMGGAQIAALYMDEQQSKESGVDDWDRDMDPATRDLLKLRHELHTLDVGIREATADADMMQGLNRDNIRRGDYGDMTTYKETSALEREAYDLRASLKSMRASVDELRMQFLKKLSDPASALLVGGMLRAQLESMSSMSARMAQNYDDAYALRNELTPASESPVTTTDDEGEELEFGSWAQYHRHLDEKSARESAKQQAAGGA